jgi:hypothetical protein
LLDTAFTYGKTLDIAGSKNLDFHVVKNPKFHLGVRAILALLLILSASVPLAVAAPKTCLSNVTDDIFDYGVGGTIVTAASWEVNQLQQIRGLEKVEELDNNFKPNVMNLFNANGVLNGPLPYVPYPAVNKKNLSLLLSKAGNGLKATEKLSFQGGFDVPSLQSSQKFLASVAPIKPFSANWKQTYTPPASNPEILGMFILSGSEYLGAIDLKNGESTIPTTWNEKLLVTNTNISTIPNQKVLLTLTVSGKNCTTTVISSKAVGVVDRTYENLDSANAKLWAQGSATGKFGCPTLKYFGYSGRTEGGVKKDYVQYEFNGSSPGDLQCGALPKALWEPTLAFTGQASSSVQQSLANAIQTFSTWTPDLHQSGKATITFPTVFRDMSYVYKSVNLSKPQLHVDWSGCPVTPVLPGSQEGEITIKNVSDGDYSLKLNSSGAFECAATVWFAAQSIAAPVGVKVFKFNQAAKTTSNTTKSTITCVNGNQTRQLTAINPDCSFLGAGWRRK